jgi:hypothetical protein
MGGGIVGIPGWPPAVPVDWAAVVQRLRDTEAAYACWLGVRHMARRWERCRLQHAWRGPLFTAQIRYSAAAALLALTAHIAGVKIVCPRGADWLWLAAIAATGLVLFNVAVIRGVGHA